MDENPYRSPIEIPPARSQTGLIGWCFQLRNWWVGMMACFVIAWVAYQPNPYQVGVAFWLLAIVYFLGISLRAWLVGQRTVRALAERHRRDYSAAARSRL